MRSALLLLTLTSVLAGCSLLQPNQDGLASDLADGPPTGPAPDPMSIPDAEPRIEPIVLGGANKPYEVGGRTYVPVTTDSPMQQRGMASWYGRKYHGKRTSSGEYYNMFAMSAAHTTMPLPSYARVRNPANGREIIVRVNDRGPFAQDRVMDLSWAAASKLGIAGQVSMVEIQRLTNAEIQARSGGRVSGAPQPASSPSSPPSPSGSGAGVGSGGARAPQPASAPSPQLFPPFGAVSGNAPARPGPAASTPAGGATSRSATASSVGGYWLQFGAFSRAETANTYKRELAAKLGWLAPQFAVQADERLHRLQAGPFKSREEAREAVERVKSESGVSPIVIERR